MWGISPAVCLSGLNAFRLCGDEDMFWAEGTPLPPPEALSDRRDLERAGGLRCWCLAFKDYWLFPDAITLILPLNRSFTPWRTFIQLKVLLGLINYGSVTIQIKWIILSKPKCSWLFFSLFVKSTVTVVPLIQLNLLNPQDISLLYTTCFYSFKIVLFTLYSFSSFGASHFFHRSHRWWKNHTIPWAGWSSKEPVTLIILMESVGLSLRLSNELLNEVLAMMSSLNCPWLTFLEGAVSLN